MPVAVIGGAGFIGSHLVDELMVHGHEVLVLDDFSEGKNENIEHWKNHKHIQVVRGKYTDLELLERCVDHVDWVFDLSFLGAEDFSRSLDVYTHSGVKRVVRSTWERDEPCVSQVCLSYPRAVYGPKKNFLECLQDGYNDLLFVGDVVRANMLAAMNREISGRIDLTSEVSFLKEDLIALFRDHVLITHGKVEQTSEENRVALSDLGWRQNVSLPEGLKIISIYENKNKKLII